MDDVDKTMKSEISEEDPEQLFRVLEVIGQGSFGVVCTCINTVNNEIVAIKFLEMEGEENSSLKKEITILKNTVRCPYIVKYHGCYIKENNLMIVMEYCDGGSILDIMQMCSITLTETQIAAILYQIVEGLVYLHSNKILHRDIKAGNVLVNKLGQAKLADFGVSAILVNTGFKQKTVVGSPYWMSPEVISPPKGSNGYDSKADIWSLGITAIEMAESKPPLFNLNPVKVIFVIPFRQAPTLEVPTNWSAEFNNFISVCLNKEADKRPSAIDLLNHPFIKKGKEHSQQTISEMVEQCIPTMKEYRKKKAEEEDEDEEDIEEDGDERQHGSSVSSAGLQKGTLLKINTITQRATVMREDGTEETSSNNGGTFIYNNNSSRTSNSGTVVFSKNGSIINNESDDNEEEGGFDSGSVVFKGSTLVEKFESMKLKYNKRRQQQESSDEDDDDDDDDDDNDEEGGFDSGSVVYTKSPVSQDD
ncbi:hypothetical protein RB653_008378 [Dictyostelium firmibasis]|uniref:non-specific serine/threonine protein kinase n=1 Tax=Dictyostelium firmibasis TaxID=79012 RepID=A0AAN7YZQ2_9MYCE